jgi:hypothetical protein
MNYMKRYQSDTEEIRSIIVDAFGEMVDHLRVKLDNPNWMPKLNISFSTHRRRSWGGVRNGRAFITMNVFSWVGFKRGTFHEYASFKHDPEIGGIDNCTRVKGLRCIVAHELAHAAQYSIIVGQGGDKCFAHGGFDDRGHGALWKQIYRDLRVNFCNGETKMEAVTQTQTTQAVVAKPVKEKKLTNRAKAFDIVNANPGKTNSEFVALVMEALKVSKANAYTYVYHARKAQTA